VTVLPRWLAIVCITALLAACSSTTNASAPQGAAPATDAILQVIGPNSTKGFSLKDLQALPAATITVDGKPQDGPAVLDVLKAAGITDFKEVTFTGTSSITLSREQITAEVILDFNNRGLVKFAATSVPQANWPKDLSKIEVK
jgi:hypothetical protein